MKTVLAHILMLVILMPCGCVSQQHVQPVAKGAKSSIGKESSKKATIAVRPRKTIWKVAGTLYFDVTVTNQTADSIVVPYIYDCLIDIDDKLYTQFPKPKLIGKDGRAIQGKTYEAKSETRHGTLKLNGPFSTVDAKSGKLPLKLAIGKHRLFLICGPYRSNTVTFELIE